MKKLYNRIVFGPDDVSIPGGDPTPEPVVEPVVDPVIDESAQDDMDDLFDDTPIESEPEPTVDPEPIVYPDVEPDRSTEPVVIEPVVIEPLVEPVVNELDELRTANAKLLEQINELSDIKEPIESVVEPVTLDSIDIKELFKDKDITELFDTKEGFLGFMQEIANQIQTTTISKFQQLAPDLVNNTVQSQNSMAQVRDAFYTDNADLQPVSKYVGKVATSLSEVNPTWTVEQVLTQAALDTRAALNIKPLVKDTTTPKPKPALPGATSRGKGKPIPTNSLADEMEDLFSDI